jgi:hypothetical protein
MAPRHEEVIREATVPDGAQISKEGEAKVRQADVDEGNQVGAVDYYWL